jgi:hypothetical protein
MHYSLIRKIKTSFVDSEQYIEVPFNAGLAEYKLNFYN